ncbi:HEAT repeat domain-containing protein [Occultella glacieicola]|uniref:HEAT repeat domain-containing protein n=1 Tax=Occultella glacieicola TaxID=2518684 RepID=A0ABY2E2D1_9MICO|nr:HEAT repeat domain-containing protein [Occultella glacieicola]TDE92770.1 HEAT repeat domain-containing protein [Occultella glacieicola]
MTHTRHHDARSQLSNALRSPDPSARLRAALSAGTRPREEYVEVLVQRCAVEPDFFVRDMLTWALTRHDPPSILDRVLAELTSEVPQARSQALHTLSKFGDRRAWPAITDDLLRDDDPEVARAAWRTAVALVPDGAVADLAQVLATQFDRGDREVRRSLSRAFVDLGDPGHAVVRAATTHPDAGVRRHAMATDRLIRNPDEGFEAAVDEANRVLAVLGAPVVGG